MTSDAWTDERVDQLKVLWTQGLSCSQIARRLGGVSRSAVIGKAHRLHLPKRAEPNRTYSRRTLRDGGKAARASATPRAPRAIAPKLKPEPLPKPSAPKLGPQSVRFINRYKYQCAMFCEGEEGALGFVCGQPTNGKDAWCSDCRAMIYQPAQERGRKAA